MADSEQPEVNAGKALTALGKSRRVVEMAMQKGKVTTMSFALLEEASQALARAEYAETLKLAKKAMHSIGKPLEGEGGGAEGEVEEEQEAADAKEGGEEQQEEEEEAEEGGKEYNIFLGQFKQKQEQGLDKYAGIVHVGLRTDGASPAFIPAASKKKKSKLAEPKGAPVVVERTLAPAKKPPVAKIAMSGEKKPPQATADFMAKMQNANKPKESEVLKKIKETPRAGGILKTAEAGHILEQLEKGAPSQVFALPETKDLHEMPFTHGIEMELQVLKKNGDWIEGSILESIFKHIVTFAHDILKSAIDRGDVPELIKGKISRIWTQEINDPGHIRGLVMMIEYELDGKTITIEALGRDPHGVGVTWLLEGVTPPCAYVEELEWWVHQMLRLSYLSVQKVQEAYAEGRLDIPKDSTFNQNDADLVMVSAGLNPKQKFVTGISFGDHHHIGIPDLALRKEVYNLFRNYLPHLIALTVNSPVHSGIVPDIKFSKNRIVSSPLSYRLHLNEGQLCSGEANTHIPHLEADQDIEFFIEATNKSDAESARLVEMFPFTHYQTIEVRVFDGQLTVQDRVGLALILQAMAKKVGKLRAEGKTVPGVSSFTLVENRKRVIKKGGLLGLKKDQNLEEKAQWFHDIYQGALMENPEENITRISHSIRNMFYFIKDELEEICPGGTYLDTFLISVFGGDKKAVDAPISQAQYQLFVLDSKCKRNLADNHAGTPSLVEHLAELGRKISTAKVYNPMIDEFGNPLAPQFLKSGGIDFGFHMPGPVYAGQDCLVSLKVKNTRDTTVGGLKMETLVFDNKHKKVFEKWDNLGEMEPDKERFFTIPVKTIPESTYFIITSTIKDDAGNTGAMSKYHIVVESVFCSIVFAGEEGGEVKTPFNPVPFVLRLKQTAGAPLDLKITTSLFKNGVPEPLMEQETELTAPAGREMVLGPEPSAVAGELNELYQGLSPEVIEQRPVKAESLGKGAQLYLEAVVATLDGKELARAKSGIFTIGSTE